MSCLLLNSFINKIQEMYALPVLLLLAAVLSGCSHSSPVEKRLDYFGEYENTVLTIDFEGISDSTQFQLEVFNQLSGGFSFDTVLFNSAGNTNWSRTITLEKPTLIKSYLNSHLDELFVLPGQDTEIRCQLSDGKPLYTFKNRELHDINTYYDHKAKMIGVKGSSDYYGSAILNSALTEPMLFEAFDSIFGQLNELLEQTNATLELPEWFIQFEKKNIEIRDKSFRKVIPIVRHFFEVDAPAFPDSLRPIINFDINDRHALTTEFYLNSLGGFLNKKIDPIKFREFDLVDRYSMYYNWGQQIEDVRVRDVFYCEKIFSMYRLSRAFPDALFTKFKRSVSHNMQPYIARIEEEFKALTGKKVPAIHLKNINGDLISLRDLRGKVVLLDFWFIGCKGCMEELPYDHKLLEAFKDKPFQIMKICMKSDSASWKKMASEFSGLNVISNEQWDKRLTRDFQISGYPRYVLVNENGVIIEGWCEKPSDPGLKKRLEKYFED